LNNFSLLTSIPINCPPYSIIVFENNNDFKLNTFQNEINQNIRIKLTDHNFNSIDLNGVHWTITIQFNLVDYVY
jgi:hypothetical protein